SLEDRPNTLIVDFGKLSHLPAEEFVHGFAKEVGFFPSFKLLSFLGTFLDGFMGTKSDGGKNSQHLTKILECFTIALSAMHLRLGSLSATTASSEVHRRVPVIVFDGITNIEHDKHPEFFEMLVDWSAMVADCKLAHVV